MDQLGPADIAFGTGDIDPLGFPTADEHMSSSGGHGLQTEGLSSHARHGPNELMFSSAQLDMSDYESSLTQNVAMGQLDTVMNTDVRSLHDHSQTALSVENIPNRSTSIESDISHIMRNRHAFGGDNSGSRAYTMNQLHGFQQIQQTQPMGHNQNASANVNHMYLPRNEQSFQSNTNFDVNAFLNTRHQHQHVATNCSVPQTQVSYMGNYVESNHLHNQAQNIQQQFIGQSMRSNGTATVNSCLQVQNRPSFTTGGISSMLSGIKSENGDVSCSRLQRPSLPPISQTVNGTALNQNRMTCDLFGMVGEVLPALKLPAVPANNDGMPPTPESLVNQAIPVCQRIVTPSPGPISNALQTGQVDDQGAPGVSNVNLGPITQQVNDIPVSVKNGPEDVSSESEDDDGMEDDKDEDYDPHLDNVTYKHKKLIKARQHTGIKENQRLEHYKETRLKQNQGFVETQAETKECTGSSSKRNTGEGITLDVGPDGATRVKMNFTPGHTMAEEVVAAFQSFLEKQLKPGQDGAVENDSSAVSTVVNPVPEPPPTVLELSFKLTTPEKGRILPTNKATEQQTSSTIKEYDKPKRSWKERAHHEQEEKADFKQPVESKIEDTMDQSASIEQAIPPEKDIPSSVSTIKDKNENEDSQDTLVEGSDDGRQEIALDEDEFEADEEGLDTEGGARSHTSTSDADETSRNGTEVKNGLDLAASVAANAVAASIITQQVTPIVPVGNTSSIDKNELNITIEDNQCVTQDDGSKRWQCLKCPKSYTTKHNLMTHILGHNGIKPYCCLLCGRFFKQISHLNTHMLTHGNIKPHVCTICNRAFTQASHAKRHMAIHMERRPYVCEICDRGFAYPSELKAHKEKHNKTKENMCELCGEGFDSAKKLQQHEQAVHKNMQDLTCKTCGKVFVYPSQLKDHEVKHSGKRPYICGECGMDFMKEHHLKAHQFTHTGLKPWFCPICERSFNQKANMQRHMLIHETDKKYKCPTCEKTFSQPQTLKAHQVTHAEKKPYQCKVCSKEFSRFHNLQGHMHMHQDSKPHICFCGASFTLKGNLNRHKKVKHGISEPVDTSEEEAAKILNAMSGNKRPAQLFSEEAYDGYSGDGMVGDGGDGAEDPGSSPSVTPSKKKRKSTPRKTIPTVKTLDGEGVEGFNGVGGVAWPGDEMVPGGPRTVIAGGMAVTITGNKGAEESDGDDEGGELDADIGKHGSIELHSSEMSNNNNDMSGREDSQLDSIHGASDHSKDGIPTDEESSESIDVQRKNLASLIAKKFKPPIKR